MPRLLPVSVAIIALAMAPGLAHAQKSGQDSRPAVMGFGADVLGGDGAATIGAGLRLFPTTGAAAMPVPVPGAPPAPPVAALPAAKPAPAAVAAPVVTTGKPAPLAGPVPVAAPGKPAPLPGPGAAGMPVTPTRFSTSPAVSARVRQEVLAAALPASPDPAALRAAVEAGAPWQEFDRLLVQHGYDPRDLADVIGAFYLIAWGVATGSDATAQPAGIAAVRHQVRQMLAGNANLARMSDAERQATAETLAFHAMAFAARQRDLQAAGADLTAYRAEVAQTVGRFQGIDLRRFVLTPAGFQAR